MVLPKSIALIGALCSEFINFICLIVALGLGRWFQIYIYIDADLKNTGVGKTIDTALFLEDGAFIESHMRTAMVTLLTLGVCFGCLILALGIFNLLKKPTSKFLADLGLLILFGLGALVDLSAMIAWPSYVASNYGDSVKMYSSYWLLMIAFIFRLSGLLLTVLSDKSS